MGAALRRCAVTTPGITAARFFRRAQELTGSQSPHLCGTLYHAHGAMGEWACRVRAGWYTKGGR